MDWTTNLIVQIVAGFAGAHLAATTLQEHRFSWVGHSLVGLIAGALSGYFLQAIALTVVDAGGGVNEPTVAEAEAAVIEALTGAAVGAIAMASSDF
jgi:pimeloyl-ACP methyl ester carboxylesterase